MYLLVNGIEEHETIHIEGFWKVSPHFSPCRLDLNNCKFTGFLVSQQLFK